MQRKSRSVISVGALVTGAQRGLVADVQAARTLDVELLPVCSAIVIASRQRVTDVTEVPSDTVAAQLEHLSLVSSADALLVSVLGEHRTADAVFRFASTFDGPFVLNFSVSGPSGETVLTRRGIDAVLAKLDVPDLVSIKGTDAELVTCGELTSLDDAQVAAQRLIKAGARRVLIRCGVLASRFFDPPNDPGGDGSAQGYMTDLYYDGDEFALFEAPIERTGEVEGASSTLHLGILKGVLMGLQWEEAIQLGKQAVAEGLRGADFVQRLSEIAVPSAASLSE